MASRIEITLGGNGGGSSALVFGGGGNDNTNVDGEACVGFATAQAAIDSYDGLYIPQEESTPRLYLCADRYYAWKVEDVGPLGNVKIEVEQGSGLDLYLYYNDGADLYLYQLDCSDSDGFTHLGGIVPENMGLELSPIVDQWLVVHNPGVTSQEVYIHNWTLSAVDSWPTAARACQSPRVFNFEIWDPDDRYPFVTQPGHFQAYKLVPEQVYGDSGANFDVIDGDGINVYVYRRDTKNGEIVEAEVVGTGVSQGTNFNIGITLPTGTDVWIVAENPGLAAQSINLAEVVRDEA